MTFFHIPIWRPHLPESIDGRPLVTNALDFTLNFPYDRLPVSSSSLSSPTTWLAFFLRPEVPILLVVAYFVSKFALPVFCRMTGINGKSSLFLMAVALHNLLLAVFSAVVFVNSWAIFLQHIIENGARMTYSDSDGSLWASGMGAWCTIFYLSKYYELVDTLILIMKGKEASFLQIYHHTGILLTMWGGVVSQASWLLIVVLLNSGIHTLMYTYFLIKTIDPKREIRAAKYLTKAQIGQFFVGILYTLPTYFLREASMASLLVCAFIDLYAVGLILLFVAFAKKKYKKK